MESLTPFTLTWIVMTCMAGAYWWGKKEGYSVGFDEGINGMAETLILAKILKREDLQKLRNMTFEDLNDE